MRLSQSSVLRNSEAMVVSGGWPLFIVLDSPTRKHYIIIIIVIIIIIIII